jgi:uncharacterized protein (TIGR02391 family)
LGITPGTVLGISGDDQESPPQAAGGGSKPRDQAGPQSRAGGALAPVIARLHPTVVVKAYRLFDDGHFASAVFEAFKAIEVRVAAQSGLDISGRPLMSAALADGGPIQLAAAPRSGNDEQEGFKLLFMGAMQGIRNPKAHAFDRPPSAQRAAEYLSLASVMLRRLDDAVHDLMRSSPDKGRELVRKIEAVLPMSVQARVEGTLTYPSSGVPPSTVVLYGGPGSRHGQLIRTAFSVRTVPFVFDSVIAGRHTPVAYAAMTPTTMVGSVAFENAEQPWLELGPGEVRSGVVIDHWVGSEEFDGGYIDANPPDAIEPGYELLT